MRHRSVDTIGAVLATLVGLTSLEATQCSSTNDGTGAGGSSGAAGATGGTAGSAAGATGGTAGGTAGNAGGATGGGGSTGGAAGDVDGGPDGDARACTTFLDVTSCAPVSLACASPEPVVIEGIDTGVDHCASGFYRRRQAVACPSELPRTPVFVGCGGTDGGVRDAGTSDGDLSEAGRDVSAMEANRASAGVLCSSDDDCTAGPLGHCDAFKNSGYMGCGCTYGCTTDAECGANQICLCGSPTGTCVPATCQQDDDCGAGFLCTSYYGGALSSEANYSCPKYLGFSCQTADDKCAGDRDCNGNVCTQSRVCLSKTSVCGVGRPFIVEGNERRASVAPRGDWTADDIIPELGHLDARVRERLVAYWSENGLMEHASIAAFARFSMHLLSLGAPSDLQEATQQALLDETKHTKMCFALASAYGAKKVGPGPLSLEGALADCDLAHVLALAVREGMVGETLAAVEAREAMVRAEDPVVRAVLEQISQEETRHAELAWRFASWAIEVGGDGMRDVIRAEVARAQKEAEHRGGECATADERSLAPHGVLTDATRRELRRETLLRVVVPCAASLLTPKTLPLGSLPRRPSGDPLCLCA